MASRLLEYSLILALLASCAATPNNANPRVVTAVNNVPFYPQEDYQCGPASLAGVLNYWGMDISPEDIGAEIYSKSAKGTLNVDMVLYVERKGLNVTWYHGSIENIKRNIELGYPLIVLVDYGFWTIQQNHFMVVVGYGDQGVLVNSGREQLKQISLEDFLEPWRKTKYWTMLITPKS